MKFKNFFKLVCISLALSVAFEGISWAKPRRTSGVGSLLEMRCYGGLFSMNRDGIIINRRPYTGIGMFSIDTGYDGGIGKDQPIEVSCDLAGRNQSPTYKTLTMTVGSNEKSGVWYGKYSAKLRLTIFVDGEFVSKIEAGFGELKRFSLDIDGKRSVAFSVECIEPSAYRTCPSLWILEDKLIQ